MRNVPRCWTYETAVMLGEDVKDELPYNDYFEYFGPDHRLHLPVSNMENLNSPEYLEHTKIQIMEILKGVEAVPGCQIQTGQVESQLNPRGLDLEIDEADVEESAADQQPDKRITTEMLGRKEHPAEF